MLSPRPDHSAPSEAQPLLLGSWSLRHVLGSSVDEQGTALRDRCDPTRGKVGGSLGQQPFLNMRLVILSADRQIPPAPQPLLGVGYTGRAPYIKVNDHQCLLCDKNHVTQGYPLNHFSVSTSTACQSQHQPITDYPCYILSSQIHGIKIIAKVCTHTKRNTSNALSSLLLVGGQGYLL